MVVLFDGWSTLFRDRVMPWRIGMAEKTRLQFETDTLPRFIETQRWYAAKGAPIERARIADHVVWQEGKVSWVVALLDIGTAAEPASYFMPLALAWEEREEDRVRNLSTAAIAKIRQQANVGIMGDAFADEAFCRAVVVAMAKRREIATAQGKLQFRPTAAFAQLAGADFARFRPRVRRVEFQYRGRHGRAADLEGLPETSGGRQPRTGNGAVSDRSRAVSELCAAAGVLEYMGNDGQTGCSPCCRPTWPIRATAGPTPWSICGAILRNIARRPPPTRCPSTPTKRSSS